MRINVEGHNYSLAYFEPTRAIEQTIQFIHKVEKDGELVTLSNGTTNEEVLAVMIDRMKNLNDKFPCRENAIVITKLEESLMWLEKRTADREARGVEGKHLE